LWLVENSQRVAKAKTPVRGTAADDIEFVGGLLKAMLVLTTANTN